MMEIIQETYSKKITTKSYDLGLRSSSYYILYLSAFISISFFVLAFFHGDDFDKIMSVGTYLAWHNIFEFSSILISFSVFLVAYFTYDQTYNLRMLLLGNLFLIIGLFDTFHTLSFKGMPEFFIENSSANRATTLWIISRLILSIGVLFTRFSPLEKKTYIEKRFILAASIGFSTLLFVLITYFPQLLPPMYVEGFGLTLMKKRLEYLIILIFIIGTVISIKEYQKTRNKLTIYFTAALIISIFSEAAFVLYISVYDIFNYLGHIYKAVAFFLIFRVIFIHNISIPYLELSEAKDELRKNVQNLDKLVDERTKELKKSNQTLLDDLEYAKGIQSAMLPDKLPDEKGVSFSAKYYPAENVSGDFYNIFKLDDQNLGMYIGDVSGHGVSAAMLTVLLNKSMETYKEEEGGAVRILKPSDVLKRLYKSFNKSNLREEIYAVLIYGVFNLETREFTYCSAGMNAEPFFITPDGKAKCMEISGFPICKFIEYYSMDYKDTTIKLKSGEKLFFYTDGLVEAKNALGEQFSADRLSKILSENYDRPINEINDLISDKVFKFIGEGKLEDDITFFVMNIK
jgi:sigma-B regulation protein RsbU (phosphoserine phosphatase)